MYRLLALFLLVAPAFSTFVEPCSGHPEFLLAQDYHCVDECIIPAGNTVQTVVGFISDHNITSMTATKVDSNGNLLMNRTDVCESLVQESGCPVIAGTMQVYSLLFNVTEALVGNTTYQMKVFDQDSVVIGCYEANVTITES